MPSALTLNRLTKAFGGSHAPRDTVLAVSGVDLDVGENELLAMVGPSGCGKSTVLRLMAGLEAPTSGSIYMGDQRVDGLPARARNIGFMFQGYALFKHMTVADNIAYGLRIKKVRGDERRRRTGELVSLMGLEGLEGRKPGQLSGGQQQRVALARALAPRPKVLLLDEPFGAVDAKVRQRLRADTKRWQRELRIPTILVTHDQREALEMGDRVAIMNEGRFEQIDTPRNIYDHPASPFVARFIGRVNVFATAIDGAFGRVVKETDFEVLVRPEDISVHQVNGGSERDGGRLVGTIVNYVFLGRTIRLEVRLKNGRVVTVALPKHQAIGGELEPGRNVALAMGAFQVFPSSEGAGKRGMGS